MWVIVLFDVVLFCCLLFFPGFGVLGRTLPSLSPVALGDPSLRVSLVPVLVESCHTRRPQSVCLTGPRPESHTGPSPECHTGPVSNRTLVLFPSRTPALVPSLTGSSPELHTSPRPESQGYHF